MNLVTAQMDHHTTTEKIQPWKAEWLAKQSAKKSEGGNEEGALREGTAHGFSKGQEVILDGTMTGTASRQLRKKKTDNHPH